MTVGRLGMTVELGAPPDRGPLDPLGRGVTGPVRRVRGRGAGPGAAPAPVEPSGTAAEAEEEAEPEP